MRMIMTRLRAEILKDLWNEEKEIMDSKGKAKLDRYVGDRKVDR